MTDDTPRQRRQKKKIDSILDVTSALIAERGLENVSLREIAKTADYSPAALYKYFNSKADIIHAVMRRENQALITLLKTAPDDISSMQRLIILSLVYIQYCLEHGVYVSLVNALSSERKSTEEPVPMTSPYMFFLTEVKKWVEDDDVSLEENYGLEEITYALWALIHGMATLRHSQLKDFDADFETINRHTIEMFLTSLQ